MARRWFKYDVPLIPQSASMGCWAAGMAMVRAWADQASTDPDTIAQNLGGISYLNERESGLLPSDAYILRRWGFTVEAPVCYTVEGLGDLLIRFGPLWIASRMPAIPAHIPVVSGIFEDPDPDKAKLHVLNPWQRGMRTFTPANRGSEYDITYTLFMTEMENLGRAELAEPNPIYVAHLP